ncbi:hypothetical protein DIPPA_08610 [Diplonema papillatum]|nr:hypothetical protein DIPPA_08610 [Diplonema papillatum]
MVADQKNYGTNRRGFFLDVMEQCSEPGAQVAQKNKKGWLRKLAPVSGSYTEVYVMVEGTLMSITPKAAERFEPKYNVVSVQILAFDPVNDVYSFVIDTKHVGGGSNSAMTFKATTEALFSEWFSALYSNCYTVMNERALLDKSDACGRYASALAEGTRALDFTVGMLRYLREQFPRGIVDLFAYLEEEKRRKEDDSVFKPDSSERKKQKKWARLIQFMTQSPAIEATSGVMVNEGLEAILSLDLSYFPKCRGLRLSRLDFKKVIAGDQVRFLQLDQCRGSVDEFEGVARIIVNNCESFNFPSLYSQSGTLVELEIHSFLRKLEDFLAFPKTRIRILESGVSWRQLKILDVSRNELVSLPRELEQLTALESLKLDYNDIKKLDNFEGLKKLQVLSAKSNQLDNVAALVCCPSLTCVELSANYIEDFPWDYLPHITVLDLAHNRLTSWADVGAFSKSCPRLQILSLEGNPLEHAIQRSDYATLCRVLFNRKFKLDGNAVGPADKDTIEAIRVKYEDTVLYREAVPNTVLSDGPSARGTDVLTTLVEKSKPQRKRVVKVRRRRRLSMSSADGDALSAAGDAPPSEKPHKKRVKRRVAKKGSALGASMASATSFDDASHSDAQMEQPAGPSPLLSKPNLAALATAPNAEPAAKPGLLGAAAPPAAPAAAASGGAAVASGAAAPAAAKPAPPAAASGAAAPAAAKPAPPAAAAPAAAASGGVASAPGGAKPAPAAAASGAAAPAAAKPAPPAAAAPAAAASGGAAAASGAAAPAAAKPAPPAAASGAAAPAAAKPAPPAAAAPAAAASGGVASAPGGAKPAPAAAASGAAAPAAAKPAPPAAAAPAAAASGGVASAPGGAKPAPAAAAASGVASAAAEPPKPSHPIPTVAVTATGEMEAASQYDAGSTVNDEDDALAKTQAATNQPTRQAPVPGLSKSLGNVRDPQAAADGSKPSPRKRSSAQLSPRDSLDWSSKQASEGAGKKSPRGSLKAAADAGGKKDPRAAAPVQDAAAEAALEHALSGEYEGASFLDQIVNAPLPDLTSTAKRVAVSQVCPSFLW